jgi:hypothetical protein
VLGTVGNIPDLLGVVLFQKEKLERNMLGRVIVIKDAYNLAIS